MVGYFLVVSFRGPLESPRKKIFHVARALPTRSVCTKGFRRIQHPILVGAEEKNTLQTHLCTTHKKNTHPLLQQPIPNFSFCPLTKKPTITPDRTHRHHVCA